MSLRVYNTLTKQKDIFEPVRPGKVGIYLCGPTVYKSPHIGHMVGPVIFDAIKRYLVFKGYEVTWVVNITDVEDKLIDAAKRENASVAELAERYAGEYHDALAALGVDTIDKFPKASNNIPEIIDLCQKLIEKGFAYSADGNVWFDVTRDPDYGKLSNRRVEDQESGARELEGKGKRNPADFALWKAAKEGEPQWDSPWGPGRPGWHIECSAMSMKLLGETFDMHGGGMDLLFPHHENELAQSESATGKTFVKYWMHNGLTRLNTKKISGSDAATAEGAAALATVRVRKLLDEHGGDLLRYLLLSTHYRRPIEFTPDAMTAAKKGFGTFKILFERIARICPHAAEKTPNMEAISAEMLESSNEQFVRTVLNLKMKFLEIMDDDFNTAGAIGVLHELASGINSFIEKTGGENSKPADVNQVIAAAGQTLRGLGNLLGMFRQPNAATPAASSEKAKAVERELADQLMDLIIQLRASAREKKDFATADAIRDGLAKLKITLEDRAGGTGWRKN